MEGLVQCKVCGDPTFRGSKFCSHSCRVEHEIHANIASVGPLPSPPALPGFSSPPASAPGGLKFDDGKIPLHLLPFDSLTEIAKVLQFGARKYDANNWRKGIVYSRLFRAAIGHCISWWMGEDLDPETGLSHLAHAGCCVLFLLHFVLSARGDVLDDRKENNA